MNSLQDLNRWGNTAIQFTDSRPTEATFSDPVDQTVLLTNDQTQYTTAQGVELLSAQSISANSTFQVTTGVSSSEITWVDPLPAGVTVDEPVAGQFRATGPITRSVYNEISTPRITFDPSYQTATTVTNQVDLGSGLTAEWSTYVVWPLANSPEWFYPTDPAQVRTAYNDIDTFITVDYPSQDPINPASVSVAVLGPAAANANLSVNTVTPVSGTQSSILVLGQVDTPLEIDDRDESVAWGSISTQLTFETTSGVEFTAPVDMRIDVDGMVHNSSEGYAGQLGDTERGYYRRVYHISSGRTDRFETRVTVDWPNFDPAYDQVLWVASGHVNLGTWNSLPIVTEFTGPNQRAVVATVSVGSGLELTPPRIDGAIDNWSTVTNPAQILPQDLTFVLEKGSGNPIPVGPITWQIYKTSATGSIRTTSFIQGW